MQRFVNSKALFIYDKSSFNNVYSACQKEFIKIATSLVSRDKKIVEW